MKNMYLIHLANDEWKSITIELCIALQLEFPSYKLFNKVKNDFMTISVNAPDNIQRIMCKFCDGFLYKLEQKTKAKEKTRDQTTSETMFRYEITMKNDEVYEVLSPRHMINALKDILGRDETYACCFGEVKFRNVNTAKVEQLDIPSEKFIAYQEKQNAKNKEKA